MDYKTVESQSYEKIIELFVQSKIKFPHLGSTQILSSEEMIPELENNQYRLKDRFMEKNKKGKKVNKYQKDNDKSSSKKIFTKNFSSLQSKSIIKEEKKGSQTKNKLDSKLKTKSKNKSKSKTVDKKTVQKQYFVKTSNSKSRRKHV